MQLYNIGKKKGRFNFNKQKKSNQGLGIKKFPKTMKSSAKNTNKYLQYVNRIDNWLFSRSVYKLIYEPVINKLPASAEIREKRGVRDFYLKFRKK